MAQLAGRVRLTRWPGVGRSVRWFVAFAAFACSVAAAQGAGHHGTSAVPDGSAALKAKLQEVKLGDWRFNGFEEVKASDPPPTPWSPFLTPSSGYVAMFINSSKDIANTGKGGGSRGSRHPQFTLWIFPRDGANTPEKFEDSIRAHQMVQSSIPTVVGANKDYILTCVGDVNEGRAQIMQLATALKIPLTKER